MGASQEDKQLRIGVNLIPLNPAVVGGVMQHLMSLLNGLMKEKDLSFTYFVNDSIKHLFDDTDSNIRIVPTQWLSPEIERRYQHGEFDVLFAPLMDPGVERACCPMVVLLVDLQHRTYPENFNRHDIQNRSLRWEWPSRAAQTLCVSTEFVAAEAIEHLGVAKEKIILTPPLLAPHFTDRTATEVLPDEIEAQLPADFLFYPSNSWPHKNHIGILNALVVLRVTVPDIRVVFTGWEHKAQRKILDTIKSFKLEKNVVWLGYVDELYMPVLYRRSRGLVFPSYFEGFGIPLIEAMASDCPIACSNRTSLPEVAGNSAIYFNPDEPTEIASAMQRLWQEEALRAELVAKGKIRLSTFDDARIIKDLADCLRSAPAKFNDPVKWDKMKLKEINKLPLVSIIVPSFQQSRFLRECIDSILTQDYPNVEIIVIDGGSTDGSVEILESYGNKIFFISEPDDGQADGINKGLSRSQGDIIGWLNSDDLYKPGAIITAVTALLGQSGCWLVYGEADYINVNGNHIGRYPTDTYSRRNLLKHCCICQPSVFFDRRLMDTAGNLNTNYDMALDYELWLRYSRFTPFLYLPETLAASRLYDDNKTAKYRGRSIKESISACKQNYGQASILWCMQLSHYLTCGIPFIGSRKSLRAPVQMSVFIYALTIHMLPNWIFKTAQYVLRALR